MGAEQFDVTKRGPGMKEAYLAAVNDAIYYYGHQGYTGSIKEKSGFVDAGTITDFDEDDVAAAFACFPSWYGVTDEEVAAWKERFPSEIRALVTKHLGTYDDKWGPAVGFTVVDRHTKEVKYYRFIGWASS